MDSIDTGRTHGSGKPHRCAFDFSVTGDVRFISHHDTLRLFRRALARASLPVRFSQGFNPHPRMVIPLPRPLGVASDAEMLVVEFERWIDPDEALSRLKEQMPAGISLIAARCLPAAEPLHPRSVTYRIERTADAPEDLDARIKGVRESKTLVVRRTDHASGRQRCIDLRPFLGDLRPSTDAIEFVLRLTASGTAKPAEVAGLLGYDPNCINHRIRRIEVTWR